MKLLLLWEIVTVMIIFIIIFFIDLQTQYT